MCVNLKPCYVNHHSRFISSTPIITSGTTLCYTDKSECLIYSQESWTFSPPKINPIGSPLSIVTFTAFMIRKKYFIVQQQARIQNLPPFEKNAPIYKTLLKLEKPEPSFNLTFPFFLIYCHLR